MHYEAKDILSQRLKYRFLEEALMETEYDDIEDRSEFLEEIEKEISRIKGEGIEVENYYSASCPEAIFRQIYEGYQSRVQKTIIWILMTWFVIPTNCFVQGRIYWLAGRNDSGTF